MAIGSNLYEKTTISGYWGLPGQPKEWAGTVTYTPDSGIELELITKKGVFGFSSPQIVGVLHGETPEHPYRITLFGRMLLGNRLVFSASELINYSISPEYMLLGEWYNSPSEAVFNSVRVTFSSLRGWMWTQSPFLGERKDNKLVVEFGGGDNLYEFPVCSIESNISFHEPIGLGNSGHRLERDNSIHITPETPQCLKCFRSHIDSIRDLLCFLTGFPVETKTTIAKVKGENEKESEVYLFHRIQEPTLKEDYFAKMTFPLRLLGDQTKNVFRAWFRRDKDQQVPFNLCLDVINSGGEYPKYDFLALVHALESHYRNVYKKEPGYVPKTLKKLYVLLPEWLQNELSFDKAYRETIRITRNYYSHYNPARRAEALKDSDLRDAITYLIPFIVALLSRELKIPDQLFRESFVWTEPDGMWLRKRWRTRKSQDAVASDSD